MNKIMRVLLILLCFSGIIGLYFLLNERTDDLSLSIMFINIIVFVHILLILCCSTIIEIENYKFISIIGIIASIISCSYLIWISFVDYSFFVNLSHFMLLFIIASLCALSSLILFITNKKKSKNN